VTARPGTPEAATVEAEAPSGHGSRRGSSRPATAGRGLTPSWPRRSSILVRGIVRHPDDVVVADKHLRRGSVLEVRVHPDDLGKVIGRGRPHRDRTAHRDGALAGKGGARVDFVDVDRRR
jgi:hypothetical protein